MITDYLLTDPAGDRILLEDSSGVILLETAGELTRVTQTVVEAFVTLPVPTRVTQVVVEAFVFIPIFTRQTQAIVEVWNGRTANTFATQAVVEVFVNLPPCTNGEMAVDDVTPTPLLRRKRKA